MPSPILELRVALTAKDYQQLVAFYEDALGLEADEIWTQGDNKGVIYDMGEVTLEILDENSAATVDQIGLASASVDKSALPLRFPMSRQPSNRR
jgi:hypothetical protein